MSSCPLNTVEPFAPDMVGSASELLPVNLEDVRERHGSYGECSALIYYFERGWQKQPTLPLHLIKYTPVEDELSVCDGLPLKGCCLVIASSLRPAVLMLVHGGHQCVNRSKARAHESVWGLGIRAETSSLIANCERCASTRVTFAEPRVNTLLPDRLLNVLVIDLFQLNGQTFILVVDYNSWLPEAVTLRGTTAHVVYNVLKSPFARQGIPQQVSSDNVPPFYSREFAVFASSYSFAM